MLKLIRDDFGKKIFSRTFQVFDVDSFSGVYECLILLDCNDYIPNQLSNYFSS